ncbi:vacuolar iron transporter-like protein 2-like [Forsythia ovata]|uniref:Vacuolar iron transporter n=1 Tax=Forsythia ovata TaxID=205694 RepID=A0ABD1WHB9_9LAMI
MAADASSEIKISIKNEEEKKMIELIERGQWLRAAILGANDGLLSTTSLMLGVGAAKEDKWLMIISGLAGAVAGVAYPHHRHLPGRDNQYPSCEQRSRIVNRFLKCIHSQGDVSSISLKFI